MEKLKVGEYYPLAAASNLHVEGKASDFRVLATGEFRPPRKGEWYLSGAIIESYQAKANLLQPYHIGRLVRGKTVTRWVPED